MLPALGTAALIMMGCGRLGFTEVALDGSADTSPVILPDSTALDSTTCDELTGTMFCESFEEAAMLLFSYADAPSFVVTDDTRSYRGARALHAKTTRASEPAWLFGRAMAGLTTGALHARAYLYVPTAPAPQRIAPLHFVASTGPNNGAILQSSTSGVDVLSSEAGVGGTSNVLLPRDSWSCVQMRILISDTAGSIESWVDGIPAGRVDGVDTLPTDGYTNVHVGLYSYGPPAQTNEIWIDELVISETSIPCD